MKRLIGAELKGERVGFMRLHGRPRMFFISRSGLSITSPLGIESTSTEACALEFTKRNRRWKLHRFKKLSELIAWMEDQ